MFTAHAPYVFGNLRARGWITLIIAVLQLLAAAGVLAGNQLARWFGVAVLGFTGNAIDMMFFIPAYPFWVLMIIAVDVVALHGLSAYGSRRIPKHGAAEAHWLERSGMTAPIVVTVAGVLLTLAR